MADEVQAPQITVEQFKLHLSIWREGIPTYEGGTRFLLHFIQQCDKFVQMLYTVDPLVNESLYALIKSKLRGETLDIVVNDPEGWTECKRILINRYSDASSEELLFKGREYRRGLLFYFSRNFFFLFNYIQICTKINSKPPLLVQF